MIEQMQFDQGPYGQHLRRLEFDGLVVTESLRHSKERLEKHSHDHTNISLVLEGSFLELVGNVQQRCEPYNLVIRPGGEFHTNVYDAQHARCLIIEVLPQRLKLFRTASPILDQSIHIAHPMLASQVARIYNEFRMNDSSALLAMDALLLDMLLRISRNGKENGRDAIPSWLTISKEYLHDHFRESIHLSDVAAAADVHPAHLAKSFQKHFRSTVGNYVRRLRLESAAQELRSSKKTLADIALGAGFYDQSHFTKSFKLQFGMTPSMFRFQTKAGKAFTKRP